MTSTALIAQLAGPGSFDLNWSTVDAGGGSMYVETISTTIQLTTTIGQPDAHAPGALHGGGFTLSGGFWKDQHIAPTPCFADVAPPGGNGFVDADDLIAIILGWGSASPDVDGNGVVDVDDLIAVILAWGSCPA